MTATITASTSLESLSDLDNVAIVQRGNGFDADGLHRERGEVLSIKGWINATALINTHLMAKAPYSLPETWVTCECGRVWENEERSDAHACPARAGQLDENVNPIAAALAAAGKE